MKKIIVALFLSIGLITSSHAQSKPASTVLSEIITAIRANGQGQITGPILNSILIDILQAIPSLGGNSFLCNLTTSSGTSTNCTYAQTAAAIASSFAPGAIALTALNGYVDGSNASNLTSGTVALARLPTIPTTQITGLAAVATSGLSSDVGYTAIGTGVAARTIASFSNDRTSVLSYSGIDATGVADSTTGINAAIADAASRSKALIFPCGTYTVDNITIVTGALLFPERRGCVTWKRKSSASGSFVATASSVFGFIIDGIIIDVNSAGNVANSGSGLWLKNSYSFSVRDVAVVRMNSTSTVLGVGIQADDCQDVAQGTSSEITGSTVTGVSTVALSGIIINRCGNLRVERNVVNGFKYAGIAVLDSNVLVPASPTNVNILVANNDVSFSGVGINVSGFTSGPGIGGTGIYSNTSFVNKSITVANNKIHDNTVYGCLLQATSLNMTGNEIRKNGTGLVYGGCATSSSLFIASGNLATENSFYGLDFGGSSYGLIQGNTIRQNGKIIGQSIGMNLGASISITVGQNDVGDNGGANGGYEVLGSAIDGGGTSLYFPWIGNGLVINGLNIQITNAAMGGLKLANGWNYVSIPKVYIQNIVNSAHPFDVFVNGSTMKIGEIDVLESSLTWRPTVASAATITIPDYASSVDISGTTAISTIRGTAQNALNGGLREFVPSNNGQNYSASTTVTCTSTGGTPATVEPARAPNGKIYGLYVLTPGSGASAMSCTASDQSCTATAGAVTLSAGAVTAVANGIAGTGCTNSPAVNITGLTCTRYPAVHANVSAGAVTSYAVDYGGSGCTGTGTATVANGSGFAGTASLGAGQSDKLVRLNFASTASIVGGGNYFSRSGTFTGDASGLGAINLKAAFGNFVDVGRN